MLVLKKCNEKAVLINIHLSPLTYRLLELAITTTFIGIKVFLRSLVRKINLSYSIRSAILVFLYFVNLIDILHSLITSTFPFVNFCTRPFIVVLVSRGIREEMILIARVLVKARTILFLLFLTLFMFALFGYFAFFSEEFATFSRSLETMSILLTLNNFPGLMLKMCKYNRASAFFFIGFLLINMMLIMGLLQAVYFEKYNLIARQQIVRFLKKFKDKGYPIVLTRSIIETSEMSNRELGSLPDNLNLIETFLADKVQHNLKKQKSIRDEQNKLIGEFLRTTKNFPYEFALNVINLTSVAFSIFMPQCWQSILLEVLVTVYFSVEAAALIKYYGFWEAITISFLKVLNTLINLGLLSYSFLVMLFGFNFDVTYKTVRFVRFFVCINKVPSFKAIFQTIKNFKLKLIQLFFVLMLVFLVFVSVMMLILPNSTLYNSLNETGTLLIRRPRGLCSTQF